MLWNDYYNHANEPAFCSFPFNQQLMYLGILTEVDTIFVKNAFMNKVEGIVGTKM